MTSWRLLGLGMLPVYPAAGELVRMLAQIAPVGIVQTDVDGQCVYANDRWCALTGTTVCEALGAGWADALHPDDIERVTAGMGARRRARDRAAHRLPPADRRRRRDLGARGRDAAARPGR